MKCYASKVIEIAQGEVGYLEKASNKNLDSKTANAGNANYTKYARDLDAIADFYNGKKNGYAWCDIFVDWCFVKAFGVTDAKRLLCQPSKSYGAGCTNSMGYYKKAGKVKTKPEPGDQVFFQNAKGEIYHTGLVYKVDKTYVYTIEGNTSSAIGVVANGGAVEKKKYKLTNTCLAGYGRPTYDKEPAAKTETTKTTTTAKTETTKTTTTKKTVTEIAKEVLDGKWGNGEARKAALKKAGYDYAEVQAKVNELSKKETTTSKTTYRTHTVKAGESLWLLATRYLGSGTRYTEIMKLNGKTTTGLKVGEKLKIPNK